MPLASFKQTNGYFVLTAALPSTLQFKASTPPSGSGGDYKLPGFSASVAGESVIASGVLLKDMGKTVLSSSHVFRKVQAVVANGAAVSATTNVTGQPFYIELATGNQAQATAAPVAYLPGLFL